MTIEQRVDQLEQRVNRYRMALAVVVVAVCAVVTMAATAEKNGNFDVVTARTIYVKNDGDKIVIALGVDDGGNGLVATFGPNGKELVELGATTEGHGLVQTYGPNGKKLVQLGASENGGAVRVYNKTGEDVVQLRADEYGNGVVGAYNRKGMGRTLESQ